MDSEIHVKLLHEMFEYDPGSGCLTWKVSAGKARKGSVAGCRVKIERNEYLKVTVFQTPTYAHRIIWAMVKGYWPCGIDHQDGNGLNNRVDNLREATGTQNGRNLSRSKVNTSGTTGVIWLKTDRKWRAGIKVDGVYRSLGSFVNIEDAIVARKAAEVKYGFHKNHDRIGG